MAARGHTSNMRITTHGFFISSPGSDFLRPATEISLSGPFSIVQLIKCRSVFSERKRNHTRNDVHMICCGCFNETFPSSAVDHPQFDETRSRRSCIPTSEARHSERRESFLQLFGRPDEEVAELCAQLVEGELLACATPHPI